MGPQEASKTGILMIHERFTNGRYQMKEIRNVPVILQHSYLPIFACRSILLRFLYPKQLLQVFYI